jgi:hypothetical protein
MAWGLRNFTINTIINDFKYIALAKIVALLLTKKNLVDINRGDDVEGGIDVVDTLQEGATLLLC